MGLKDDGYVVTAGSNIYGQCNVTAWTGITAAAAGGAHTVGLKSDGTVVAVGYNGTGACNVSGWQGITAIAVGYEHTVGLKAAPAQLAFAVQPSRAAVDQPILPPVQVAIRDRFGNTVGSADHTVTLALGANPGGAHLLGTLTAAAVNGIATFSGLRLDRAGAVYTLVATSPGLDDATSNGFTIAAGPPAKLAFAAQPSQARAGDPFAVTVAIQDQNGNPVATAANTISLRLGSNPGSGSLSGVTTAAASGGQARFSGLSMDRAAAGYTLIATSGDLQPATSAALSILPGAASALAFLAQPANAIVSGSIAPPVQVEYATALATG